MKEKFTEEVEYGAYFAEDGVGFPGITMDVYKRIEGWVIYQIRGLSKTNKGKSS